MIDDQTLESEDDSSLKELIELNNSINKKDETTQRIHWNETHGWRGDPLVIIPNAEMLEANGCQLLRIRTTGRKGSMTGHNANGTYGQVAYWVIYDRSYVVRWLQRKVIDRLVSIPFSELLSLLGDAKQEWNEANGIPRRRTNKKKSEGSK